MLTGEEAPDGGSITLGPTVDLAYVDQSRDSLDGDRSVWEEIADGEEFIQVGTYKTPSRAYVGRFNFRGSEQQKRVKDLSGGERNRVHLAKLLRSGGNLLLLDEPTNDLDVETLRALEEALLEFPGCAVVISHDRWFLDRIATHMLAFEGDSHVEWYEGNYSEYEADLKRRIGDDADTPHRMKYPPAGRLIAVQERGWKHVASTGTWKSSGRGWNGRGWKSSRPRSGLSSNTMSIFCRRTISELTPPKAEKTAAMLTAAISNAGGN